MKSVWVPEDGIKVVDEIMSLISEMSCDGECLSLEDFLLPDDHPIVLNELKRLTELRATTKLQASTQEAEWPKQHASRSAGLALLPERCGRVRPQQPLARHHAQP